MLDKLQLEQFKHDEVYHREITRLPLQQRLRHMALHFAKYSGNLVEARVRGENVAIQRIATDVFIIGMSTANALNFRLAAELSEKGESEFTLSQFATNLAVNAGRMAAACEKLDHVEEFPFRSEMRRATINLVASAAGFVAMERLDLVQLVRFRLKPVKEKFIYHGQG